MITELLYMCIQVFSTGLYIWQNYSLCVYITELFLMCIPVCNAVIFSWQYTPVLHIKGNNHYLLCRLGLGQEESIFPKKIEVVGWEVWVRSHHPWRWGNFNFFKFAIFVSYIAYNIMILLICITRGYPIFMGGGGILFLRVISQIFYPTPSITNAHYSTTSCL